ncbi:MAG: hypothetical protein ACI9SB_002163 [Candidatus Azotimanducaceae bacterium]|jgi:hypothetical protein
MNWQAVGAVREVIGASAVLATLVYCAIQIRRNNRHVETTLQTMRLGAADATVAGFARYRELVSRKEIAYEKNDWLAHMNGLRINMGKPGITAYWLQRISAFPADFVEEIEMQMSAGRGDA